MTDLSPTTKSACVFRVFIGGPIDGYRDLVEAGELDGSIPYRGGEYSLQGFRPPAATVLASFDSAVYLWET